MFAKTALKTSMNYHRHFIQNGYTNAKISEHLYISFRLSKKNWSKADSWFYNNYHPIFL